MGRKVLVSVLGRGRQHKDGTGYTSVKYCFEDGYEHESSFFTHSLWRWLKNTSREPDALIILGTSGSMWDALWDVLPENIQNSEEIGNWKTYLHQICRDEKTSIEDLDVRKAPFSLLPFSSGLKLDLIPDCRNSRDIQTFCQVLLSHLEPGDEVILDITHGYRHLPVLASFLTTSLRWLMNIVVRDVFYGAMEMGTNSSEGVYTVPVVNLGYAATLFEQGAAYATFNITGRYGALAQFFPDYEKDIRLADYYENIGQIHAAQPYAEKLCQSFFETKDSIDDAWLATAAHELMQEWRWSRDEELHQRMFTMATNLFRRDEFYKSIIMLQEAFHLYVQKQIYGAYKIGKTHAQRDGIKEDSLRWMKAHLHDEDMYHIDLLRRLRNALAHSQQGSNRQLSKIIASRSKLITVLENSFRLISRMF